MIGKLPVLGFSLVTALSGQALARDCDTNHTPAGYGYGTPAGHGYATPAGYGYGTPAGHGQGNRNGNRNGHGYGGYQAPVPQGPPIAHVDWSARAAADLRYSDLNRDGYVSLQEALDHGRYEFQRNDRDGNRVLTRHEVDRPDLYRGDWNRDGRVSIREYQNVVRTQFARFDRNRDGFLARYELGGQPERPQRSAGWWR
jgi:hypothetical protein